MRLNQLDTPCLLLDRARLEGNAQRMQQRAQELGVELRPHLKTAKSIEVARIASGGPPAAITVATLNEAEYFASHGVPDILYAVCVTPNKLDRVARLNASAVRVSVIVDSMLAAKALAEHPGQHAALLEIDCGEDRTGLSLDDPALLDIARCLHQAPRCRFRGVMTHGGHSYKGAEPAEIRAVAEQERSSVVEAAERLRQAQIPCQIVSVGSTPTATHALQLEGVTEMRPGVYLFGDLFQAGIGCCAVEDIACSVLATVISHRRTSNRLVIDAGGLALSKDRSTAGRSFDAGYGRILAGHRGEPIHDLQVYSVHQEHGEVGSADELPWQRLPIGALVRVLPNHVCMTAAMYDRYFVLDEAAQVMAEWDRSNGW